MDDVALFACTQCLSKHPYEELTTGQQLCKDCRASFPVIKCIYCRTEFQLTSKRNSRAICKACEINIKAYGKPSVCKYCNIFAAFIGPKCKRCTNAEIKYGSPVNCDHCHLKCAFTEQGDKMLCWLCSLSLTKAIDKFKTTQNGIRKQKISNRVIGAHLQELMQLQDQFASLKNQMKQKDQQLLNKDKMITSLKATHFTTEKELRNKLNMMQKNYEQTFDRLQEKFKTLQKEIAKLKKIRQQ